MSKVVIFWPYIPKFFWGPFFRDPQIYFVDQYFFPHKPNKASPAYYFFTILDLKNYFLDFIDLKNLFFRPKKLFLDFLDLKISLNPLKTLRKHLFSLQINEKNNIFLNFIAKNYPSYHHYTLHSDYGLLRNKSNQ